MKKQKRFRMTITYKSKRQEQIIVLNERLRQQTENLYRRMETVQDVTWEELQP